MDLSEQWKYPARKHGGVHAGRRARPRDARAGGSLDNTTNNSAFGSWSAFQGAPVDQSTGEILPKFDLTRKWELQTTAKRILGGHRVGICMSAIRRDWNQVQIRTSKKSGRCYYAGLMACGSVWACPVCAAKIQQVRADEVRRAIANGRRLGYQAALLTLTVPHTRHDDLKELLTGFGRALTGLWSDEAWKKAVKRYGVAGYIRALEVTWGEGSGWHPHAHVVVFVDQAADLDALAEVIFPIWARKVARADLGEASRQAFTLQDGTHASRYVNKMAEELVRSHTKSASGARFSPFDLLGEVAFGDHDAGARARFAVLFRTYAEAFHGRRQLQWSQGLKARWLGNEGPTDGEIADSLGFLDEVLAVVTHDEWRRIRSLHLRGALLVIAELHGADGVGHFLRSLPPWPDYNTVAA